MHLGGTADLPVTAFETDALGGPQGELYAVALDPMGDQVRLSVVPRPAEL